MNILSKKIITSLQSTKDFASRIANFLSIGDIIVLNGELGSGKTTFVSEICSTYGINEVSSPSFSIVNEYFGKVKVYHFDFYRIRKKDELYDLGFDDYLTDANAIIFIEWGNLFPDIIPSIHYELQIFVSDIDNREIILSKHL